MTEMRRLVAPLILILLGASLLAGPALADHAYSHRYQVFGRVIDSEGLPVQGVTVDATYEGSSDADSSGHLGACGLDPRSQPRTDALGQYYLCGHHHAMSRLIDITVTAAGESVTERVDADLRRSVINFQLDEAFPESRGDVETFTSTHTVLGVVWKKASDVSMEGVSVNGETQSDAPVEATLTLSDGTTRSANATTDGYGNYELTFQEVPEDLAGATVEVTSEGETVSRSAASPYRLTHASVKLPEDPVDLSFLWVVAGIAAAGAVVYGGYRGYNKMQEQRELDRVREQSGRKRANR